MTTSQTEQQLPRPLEGIKVLEYGVFHAGPGAGAILGDLGAEVIKIEAPSVDPLRFWTQIAGLDFSLDYEESLIFEASNRNKKGICLDIKTDKGKKILEHLLQDSDVFITNLKETTRRKLGIDYAAVSRLNEKIIYALVTGYGPNGPMKNAGAFDPLGQARSGMTFVTGTTAPALTHIGLLDQTTSIALSQAILTALFVRERRGVGQEVQISLYSTALWMQYVNLLVSCILPVDPCITSNRFQHSPLRNSFKCRDGKWILGTHHPEEKYWAAFCHATGQAEILDDPRFTSDAGKPISSEALITHFDKVFATRSRDAWMEIFLEHGLMFCSVQHISEVKDDPQALVNNYVVPFEHPHLGNIKLPGYPIHFSECSAGTQRGAPRIGEHTSQVLKGLGISDEEIETLRAEKIIR